MNELENFNFETQISCTTLKRLKGGKGQVPIYYNILAIGKQESVSMEK